MRQCVDTECQSSKLEAQPETASCTMPSEERKAENRPGQDRQITQAAKRLNKLSTGETDWE